MALRKLIEVFENERYVPIAGWGRPGLANDRMNFTNREGTQGTSKIEDFEAGLLSQGWAFEEEDWSVCKEDENCDADGYSYCVDFSGFGESSPCEKSAPKSSCVFLQAPESDLIELLSGASVGLVEMEMLNRANEKTIQTPPASPLRRGSVKSPESIYTSQGTAKGSAMQFVRRRRLLRWMSFYPLKLLSDEYYSAKGFGSDHVPPPTLTCEWTDYQELEKLAALLLNTLAEASLNAHPRHFDEVKCAKLRSGLLLSLDLKHAHNDMVASNAITAGHEGITAGGGGEEGNPFDDGDKMEGKDKYCYDFAEVKLKLDGFATSRKSIQATLSGAIGGEVTDRVSKRESDISSYYFSYPERRSIAEMIIRGSDRRYQFHCNQQKCGDDCRFKPAVCPHDGCGRLLSRVHHADHDAICIYKPIPCKRGCTSAHCTVVNSGSSDGEEETKEAPPTLIPRREMENHVNLVCPLRPSDCPFHGLGCMAPGLRALDVVGHLEECAVSHSLLTVERVLELSQVVKELNARNAELENTVAALVAADVGHKATMTAAIRGMEKQFGELREKDTKTRGEAFARMERSLQNKFNQISQSGESLSSAQKQEKDRVNGEFAKIAQALSNQKALIANLQAGYAAPPKPPKK